MNKYYFNDGEDEAFLIEAKNETEARLKALKYLFELDGDSLWRDIEYDRNLTLINIDSLSKL